MNQPRFPVDDQTLDLVAHAVDPGPDGERSSLTELCHLYGQMDGFVSYHPNDVVAALVAEVRRLRAGPTFRDLPDDVLSRALNEVWCAAVDASLSEDFDGDDDARERYRVNVMGRVRKRLAG